MVTLYFSGLLLLSQSPNAGAVEDTAAKVQEQQQPEQQMEQPEQQVEQPEQRGQLPALATVERVTWVHRDLTAELLLYTNDLQKMLTTTVKARSELERVYDLLDPASPKSGLMPLLSSEEGQQVVLSPEVFDALSDSIRVARLSSGAYDPTAEPVLSLWGFSGGGQVPEPDQLKAAVAKVNFRHIQLNQAEHTGSLRSGAKVHLGSLRRGFAMERAAAVLEQGGVTNFVLRAGGDLIVRGSKGGNPWMVGVQDPRGAGYFAAFPIENRAVATAGDYEHFFFRAGVRFHDVVDPRTGVPARQVRSVTVIAHQGSFAAALSRAIFVLGVDAGLDLVGRLEGAETIIVDSQNRVFLSRGLLDDVRYRPPTNQP